MTIPAPDPTAFPFMTLNEVEEVLGQTVKRDESNKIIVFICFLLAFTKDSQFNVYLIGPSSGGKSFIILEIVSLFPSDSVLVVAHCSPTAFYHDVSEYNAEKKAYYADLSRMIIVFLDQQHTMLLQNLRPLLSHDQPEITIKITDKTKSSSLRTKTIILKGFPSVAYCSASFRMNEQEATRAFVLSPDVDQQKLRASVNEKIIKEGDTKAYVAALEANPKRNELKERIKAIRFSGIQEIKLSSTEAIEKAFLKDKQTLKPRHSRDVSRVIALAKGIALLNFWYRKREGQTLIANEEDVEQAIKLWNSISESQELGLPKYLYDLYLELFYPLLKDNHLGVLRQIIAKKYRELYDRPLQEWQLRREILPLLEDAGLIVQYADPSDRRRTLIILAENYCDDGSSSESRLKSY